MPSSRCRASCELAAAAVAHRDHELVADEQVDLPGLDGVVLVDVPERLEHHEQAVVVALELGPLVRVERVLDRQRVQVEDLGDGVQLVARRARAARPRRSRRGPVACVAHACRGRGCRSPPRPVPRRGTARCRRSRGHASDARDGCRRPVGSRHGNGDPGPARPHHRQRLGRARRPDEGRAPRRHGREQARPPHAAERSPRWRWPRGHQPAGALPARPASSSRPGGAGHRRPSAADRVRLRRLDGRRSRTSARNRCGGRSRPSRRRRAFPGGESMAEMSARAVAAVRELGRARSRPSTGPTRSGWRSRHGDVIKAVLADALGHAPRPVPADHGRPGQPLGRPLHRAPRRSW